MRVNVFGQQAIAVAKGQRVLIALARFLAAGGPEPQQHLQLALEALAEAASQRWMEREGVCDDISIIVAEIARA